MHTTRRVTIPAAEELLDLYFPVLDHGFIALKDYMGGDEAIDEAARTSCGAGTRKVNERRGLIRTLRRNLHCYIPDMEVLTARGWLRWDDCRSTELFMVPDPVTGLLHEEQLELEVFNVEDEELFCFENERMSYAVTRDHRMWFKGKYRDVFEVVRVQDMPKWGHFDPLSNYGRYSFDGERDTFFEFVGFYLGDGSYASTNRLSFHLRKDRKKKYLRELLQKLEIPFEVKPSSTYEDASIFYVITPERLRELLGESLEARAKDKAFPLWELRTLEANQLRGLLHGLMSSDGSDRREREQNSFHSSSQTLRRLFQAVCALMGIDAHHTGAERVTAYFGDRTTLEARKEYFSTKMYTGKVYCTTTSTGLLMVRGGPDKFGFVCGNTSPFEMCELKFHCSMPIFVARQWIRHRTACLSADTVLHFDLPGGLKRRGNQLYKLSVGQIYANFQKDARIKEMYLRCLNEETHAIGHTHIVDIWASGVKPVYRVVLDDGSSATMSKDHQCLTNAGWALLKEVAELPTKNDPSWHCDAEFLSIGPGRGTGVVPQFNAIDEATENWAPIPGWGDYYEVSDQGRVRRTVGGKGSRSFGRCKKITAMAGRAVVSLNRPGVQVVEQVHELVLMSFVGRKPAGTEGCHNDGNALNNQLSNLRWDTPANNAKDRIRDGATTSLRSNLCGVTSIEYVGEELTYDLEVEGPWHNFSAGGMVVHNSVNEYSGRYSVVPMLFYMPDDTQIKKQSKKNRQGRGEQAEERAIVELQKKFNEHRDGVAHDYEWMVAEDFARELARIDLPLSSYTQWYWKIDLHNLFHFLGLRCDGHAQYETRAFANVMAGMAKRVAPLSFEAWIDYFFAGTRMSRMEMEVLRMLLRPGAGDALLWDSSAKSSRVSPEEMAELGLSKTEIAEFAAKFRPKEIPSFELDLSTAKDGTYFAKKWEEAVPKIDRTST